MSADEKLRLMNHQLLLCFRIVSRRIATDVTDHYLHLFTNKNQLLRKLSSYILSIDIAIHAFNRQTAFSVQTADNFYCPKISCMPDLVALFEMHKYVFIQITMSV